MHLYDLTYLTCLTNFFSYKKLSKKCATCAISYLCCQIRCSKNCPKNIVHCAILIMSTLQYTLRQPVKKCCPSYVHSAILVMSTVQYTLKQLVKKCCSSHVLCAIYSQTNCSKMLSFIL